MYVLKQLKLSEVAKSLAISSTINLWQAVNKKVLLLIKFEYLFEYIIDIF